MIYDASSPAALTYRPDGAEHVRTLARRAAEAAGSRITRRTTWSCDAARTSSPAGLDESVAGDPHVLRGRFVDLFDAGLPIVETVTLAPGSRRLLLDLERALARSPAPAVLASAGKVLGAEKSADGAFKFYCRGAGQDRGGRPPRRGERAEGCDPGRQAPRRRDADLARRIADRAPPLPQRRDRALASCSLIRRVRHADDLPAGPIARRWSAWRTLQGCRLPFDQVMHAAGLKPRVAIDATTRPVDFHIGRCRLGAEAEVEPAVAGREEAAAAEPPGDLRAAADGRRGPSAPTASRFDARPFQSERQRLRRPAGARLWK